MMVLGLGLDLVDTETFGRQLDDAASGFVAATFTPAERRAVPSDRSRRPRSLAARFAAKEAFVKAWSSTRLDQPPSRSRIDLRDVEVVKDAHGRPSLRLHGDVAAALAKDFGTSVDIHLSLSHDGPVAAAVVVLAAP